LKIRVVSVVFLTILCLALSAPAFADIYNDGPTNGTYTSVGICCEPRYYGQSISDGFVAANSGTGTEVFFAEWVRAGALPTGVTWAIGTQNFGGTLTAGANFGYTVFCLNGQDGCGGSGFQLFDVYISHFTLPSIPFTAGQTYWLTLAGAFDNQGFGAYWDVNNGPATCDFESGPIVPGGGLPCGVLGESFTITSGQPTTPEPSSILLLGSGILGLAGVLRRKLTR
jgi:hypothetical protein